MIKKMLIFILFIFNFESNSRAFGGDWVGNGASFAENLFLSAYQNIETYIDFCRMNSECFQNESDLLLLGQLRTQIQKEKKEFKNLIRFLPHSPFFIIQDDVKVAVTGLKYGDLIYINRDLINQYLINPHAKPFTFQEALSILVHEFAHHLGLTDHQMLDQIGKRVASNQWLSTQYVPIDPRSQFLGAQLTSSQNFLQINSNLIFIDELQQINMQFEMKNYLTCPIVNNQNTYLIRYQLWNLSWGNTWGVSPHLKSLVALLCQKQNGQQFQQLGDELFIEVGLQRLDGKLVFDKNKFNFKLKPCTRNDVGECMDLRIQSIIQNIKKEITK